MPLIPLHHSGNSNLCHILDSTHSDVIKCISFCLMILWLLPLGVILLLEVRRPWKRSTLQSSPPSFIYSWVADFWFRARAGSRPSFHLSVASFSDAWVGWQRPEGILSAELIFRHLHSQSHGQLCLAASTTLFTLENASIFISRSVHKCIFRMCFKNYPGVPWWPSSEGLSAVTAVTQVWSLA